MEYAIIHISTYRMKQTRHHLLKGFSYRFKKTVQFFELQHFLKNNNTIDHASRFNISPSTYRRYIKGVSYPSWCNLIKISNAYSIPPQWLIYGEKDASSLLKENTLYRHLRLNLIQSIQKFLGTSTQEPQSLGEALANLNIPEDIKRQLMVELIESTILDEEPPPP